MNLTPVFALALFLSTPPRNDVQDLYIARHGQTEWNRIGRWQGDPDLDPRGYEDRVALFLLLRDVPVERVFTSTRQRTMRTAEPIAEQRKLKAVPDADLDELDGGLLVGLCYSLLDDKEADPAAAACRDAQTSPPDPRVLEFARAQHAARKADKARYRPPGGESYLDAVPRIQRFLSRHRADLSRRTVLVVGHGGTNRILLAELMGWPLEAMVHNPQENSWVYRVHRHDDGTPRLSLFREGAWRPCEGPPDPVHGLACAR
ncbi:MAG: histidine phosphatase family protein [Pseudomonadota bacterium]